MPAASFFAAGHLPCGLVCFDDDGRQLASNAEMLGLLGHEVPAAGDEAAQAQVLGRNLCDLLTPASRILYLTGLMATLRLRGRVAETYLVMRQKDGSDLPVLLNVERRVFESGARSVAVVIVIRDRKRLEEELLRARRSVEQVPGVVYQFLLRRDGSSCFPYANEVLQEIFGVTPAQAKLSAQAVFDRIHPDDLPRLHDSIHQSASLLTRWNFQFRVQGSVDMQRWIEGRATPQPQADGSVLWHGYLCDVSERHAMEALARDKELAERANQAKGAFLARASHELRTPLNAVLGFTQLLAGDPALTLNPQQRGQMNHIESAGRHLLTLINEVLDIERLESGTAQVLVEPVRLEPVAREAAALVELLASDHGVELTLDLEPHLWVLADARKLLQCLGNLLSNAVKYNRPRGSVVVRARRHGNEVAVAVLDSGLGLNEEQIVHLFEPFNRLGAERTKAEGSGLGLAITRGLTQRMGGRLEVRSKPGQGSCFTVQLSAAEPLVGGAPQGVQWVGTSHVHSDFGRLQAAHGSFHVLYVEDNPVNLVLMQGILDRLPEVRCTDAASGALAEALALADPPALMLLDFHLPDTTGLKLLAKLRAHPTLAQIPAVMVSADAMPEDLRRARAAGFVDYWVKPLNVTETQAAISRLMRLPPATD
jgi:signal transduction histidine kinase/ActR/RegA family two-component response regulator